MDALRLTGQHAGVVKYDIITALSLIGLGGGKGEQASMLRLVALVTARYNWRDDEFSVGQRDLARMWSVNERTVKREIKRLTDKHILICRRQGVRGRVGAYRLNQVVIARLSSQAWGLVGPDFERRMTERYTDAAQNVVPLRAAPETPDAQDGTTWSGVLAELNRSDPGNMESWYRKLRQVRHENGVLHLSAPSPFIQRYVETHLSRRLADAVHMHAGPTERVVLTCAPDA